MSMQNRRYLLSMRTLLQTKFKMASFIKAVDIIITLIESAMVEVELVETVISWACMLQNVADLCDNQGNTSREHRASLGDEERRSTFCHRVVHDANDYFGRNLCG